MHTYKMHYTTAKGRNMGSENLHLSPMTIREMNETLSYWHRNGFEVINLKIWRA